MRWQVVILGVIVAISALAPFLAPYDPMLTATTAQMQPPTWEHPLGTDMLGRDALSRLLYGGRQTLLSSLFSTGIAVGIGLSVGIASAETRGLWSHILTALTNALLAFPNLLVAMVVLTILGGGLIPLVIATGITQIAPFARVICAAVIGVSAESYVESGYGIGATRLYIVRHYILPNILPTFLTYTAITFTYCLLNGAALSFLGLGGEPGMPDWGVMLAEGRNAFRDAPWIAIAPGLAITMTVWSINSFVDYVLTNQPRQL